jgi:hypothetical protein
LSWLELSVGIHVAKSKRPMLPRRNSPVSAM